MRGYLSQRCTDLEGTFEESAQATYKVVLDDLDKGVVRRTVQEMLIHQRV